MNKKIFLWIIVMICLVSSVFGAVDTVIYNHTFQGGDDWTDPNGICTGGTTLDGFTGMRIKPTASQQCYHDHTDITSGMLVAQFELYTKVLDNSPGHFQLGWDNTDTPVADGSFTMQSQSSTQVRFIRTGESNFLYNWADGETHNVTYKADFDNNLAQVWIDGTLESDTSSFTETVFASFGFEEHSTGFTNDMVIKNLFLCNVTVWSDNCTAPTPATPSNFSVTATNTFFGEKINIFNITINGTFFNTIVGEINTTLPNSGDILYNLSISAPDHDTRTYTDLNISSDLAAVLNFSYYRLNLTASDARTSAAINYFIGNATSQNDSYQATTSTGSMVFNVSKNVNYTVTIDNSSYQLNPSSIIVSDWLVKFNASLYTTNSINFNFAQNNDSQPVFNVSIELIGSTQNYNVTTTPNSSIYLDLVVPDSYTIIYSNPNYQQGYYSFTLTNRSFNNLTLYFATGDYSNITATVYDEEGKPLPDALIEVFEYNINSHNYQFVQQAATNFEGQAILYLTKFTTFYRFNIKYDGELKKATEPTYILDNTITFQITTKDLVGEDYYTSEDITYSLVFNNNTNNFRYEYTDTTSSTVTRACLKVEQHTGVLITDLGSSCNNGVAGTILFGITPRNDSYYIARAYATWDGTEHFIDSILKSFAIEANIGKLGLYLITMASIVMMFTSIWNPIAGVLLTPLPYILGRLIFFIDINIGILLFMEVIAVIIAYLISKKS